MSSSILSFSVLRSVLLASACPSVLIFAEDWTRKLSNIRNFLRVKDIYRELLRQTRLGSEEMMTSYSLSGQQCRLINRH